MSDDRSQGRAAQETQRRRRRSDEALSAAKRLPIPPEVQAWADANDMHLRWVNDEGNRMYLLTEQDDYNKVENVQPVPVMTGLDGKPIEAHLLAKPKAFMQEDQDRAEAKRKRQEDALFRSPDEVDRAGAGENPNPANVQRYVSKDSKIGRANQVLDG
jgi:hypothetical protein